MRGYKLGTGALAATVLAAPSIVHMSAYENNISGLVPDIYDAMDVVSRELVGFIPSVNRDASVERAAVGQTVTYQIAPEMGLVDIVPSMQKPTPPDHTIGKGTMTITNSKASRFGFAGEQQRALNSGPGYLSVQAGLIAQSLRTLTNAIETDLSKEAVAKASRAYGTAGTAPFETDLKASAQVKKILDDNGAPQGGRSLILNTSAGANMRSLRDLTRVNEAGTQMTLRDGVLLDINGFAIKESAQSVSHTGGNAAGAQTDGTAYAAGATTINLGAVGAGATGDIKVGDVISFAGDSEKYVVTSGDIGAGNGGPITISAPGLRRPITGAVAVTVAGSYDANVAFSADAMHLAARAPLRPEEGDEALDVMMITDPRSGLVFEFSIYAGYRMIMGEIAMAWGVHGSKREHIALLLG